MEGQAANTVEWVLFMSSTQSLDRLFIASLQYERPLVVATAGNTQFGYEVFLPSRVDFLQDGYSFDRCISAVARPSNL